MTTTTLIAPNPGQSFQMSNGGRTYTADANGVIPAVNPHDIGHLIDAGCTFQPITLPSLSGLPVISAAAVNLIVDTDIASDCDDVGALAVACAAQRLGAANIAAVITTTKNAYSAACAWQILRYCLGANSIPVAAYNGSSTKLAYSSNYTQTVAQGSWGASPVAAPATYPGHVAVARQAMANWETAGVQGVYALIGTWTSLAEILASAADGISPLNGVQLFSAAVSRLYVMGGNDINNASATPETNLTVDAGSVISSLALLPSTIERVWSPYQLGSAINTVPLVSASSPISTAYTLFAGSGNTRSSWDPSIVLHAIFGDRGIFDIVGRKITNLVTASGANKWQAVPGADTCLGLKSTTTTVGAALAATVATMIDSLFAVAEPAIAVGTANASNVFTGMSGLQWWIAPSDPSTVFTTSGKVSQVLDLSGNALNAVTCNDQNAQQPTYATNQVNSLGALSFAAGGVQALAMDGLAPMFNSPATPFHIFMLIKAASVSAEACFFSILPASPANHFQMCISLTENGSGQAAFGRVGIDNSSNGFADTADYTANNSNTAVSTSVWTLLEASYNPAIGTYGQSSCRVSGGTANTANLIDAPVLNLVSARLMAKLTSDSSNWGCPGLVAEVGVFNTIQSGATRTAMITRMNTRYGLNLPTT